MRIGILADSHDQVARTQSAVGILQANGSDLLVHCGDLACPQIVAACAVLPFYFVFGNHDANVVPELLQAANTHDATCLAWGGEFSAGGKRIAVVHGHMTMDLKPLLDSQPDYLLSGHSHIAQDLRVEPTRRINPGALFRADEYTVAILDIETDVLRYFHVPD